MGDLRTPESKAAELQNPALLFDLDGTLIDTAYEHALAWSSALRAAGLKVPTWKIYRHIGMSGKSLIRQLGLQAPCLRTFLHFPLNHLRQLRDRRIQALQQLQQILSSSARPYRWRTRAGVDDDWATSPNKATLYCASCLVEAAQVTVRSDPRWRSKYHRLMMRRGRKIAKVAMARRLAVRMYWMMRKEWNYEQLKKFGSHAGQLVPGDGVK